MTTLTKAQRRLLDETRLSRMYGHRLRATDARPAQALIRKGLAWRQSGMKPRLRLTDRGKEFRP